jgi:hypothetical protein
VYSWGLPNYRAFVAPAPRQDIPAPQVSVLEDSTAGGRRTLRLLLTSNRGALEAAVVIPANAKLISASVDGETVPMDKDGPNKDFRTIGSTTLPPDGMEIVLVLGQSGPLNGYVYDQSEGLPPAGEALVRARPASAVTSQEGDTTTVVRKIEL